MRLVTFWLVTGEWKRNLKVSWNWKERDQRSSQALQMSEALRKVEALQKRVLEHYFFLKHSNPVCFHEINAIYSADMVSRQYVSVDV